MTETTKTLTIPISDVREGDELWQNGRLVWRTLDDATRDAADEYTQLTVQFRDGGTAFRVWDDPTHLLTVQRIVIE